MSRSQDAPPFPFVYVGEPREYEIPHSLGSSRLMARPFAAVDREGKIAFGLGNPDLQYTLHDHISSLLPGTGDAVAAYHAYCILQGLGEVHTNILHQLAHIARREAPCNTAYADEIRRQLGEDHLAELLAEPPPNLFETLATLAQKGIEIDKEALERELLAGCLAYCVELDLLGVRPAQVIRERQERGAMLTKPYEGYLDRLVAELTETFSFGQHDQEMFRRLFRGFILEALERKITATRHVVGGAALFALRAVHIHPRSVSLMDMLFETGFNGNEAVMVTGFKLLAKEFPTQPHLTQWPSVLWEALRYGVKVSKVIDRRSGEALIKQAADVASTVETTPRIVDLEAEL